MQRSEHLQKLKTELFDLLVIGAGATGAGIALDAATRGLKVALVEKNDFCSGTSSRSTKLIHGGVRYLELAVKQLDKGQLFLVKEALHERAILLKLAPHLTRVLELITPLYKTFQLPYYRVGLKVYDWLAGKANLQDSRIACQKEILSYYPHLKSEGLKGGVLYVDGQFDDARMAISIVLTAENQGAVVARDVAVEALLKENGTVSGATVRDRLEGSVFEIRAKSVVNATGPFVDHIRQMDDAAAKPIVTTSSGIHIMLKRELSHPDVGILFPKTEDGRVLFMLPWLGYTLLGTTDHAAPLAEHPKPTEADIDYLLSHIRNYLKTPIQKKDILAAWCGLRPLVSNADHPNTAHLSRDHVILTSPSGLITITGGKWTTYRKMALDAVDEAIKTAALAPKNPSRTEETLLIGAHQFRKDQPDTLEKKYGISQKTARYLSRAYGDRAEAVVCASGKPDTELLLTGHPFLKSEILYALQTEHAVHAIDFLARRTRLAFLDRSATLEAMPTVIEWMGEKLGWDLEKREEEKRQVEEYLS